MEVSAQEFSELIESLRDRGIVVPDEVEDCRGLIIAVKAGGGRPHARGRGPRGPSGVRRGNRTPGAAPHREANITGGFVRWHRRSSSRTTERRT